MASIPTDNASAAAAAAESTKTTVPRKVALGERASIAASFDTILQTTFQSSQVEARPEVLPREPRQVEPVSRDQDEVRANAELDTDNQPAAHETRDANDPPSAVDNDTSDENERTNGDSDAEQDASENEQSSNSEDSSPDDSKDAAVTEVKVRTDSEIDEIDLDSETDEAVKINVDLDAASDEEATTVVPDDELQNDDADQQESEVEVDVQKGARSDKVQKDGEGPKVEVVADDQEGGIELDAETLTDDGRGDSKRVERSQKRDIADNRSTQDTATDAKSKQVEESLEATSREGNADAAGGSASRRVRHSNGQVAAANQESAQAAAPQASTTESSTQAAAANSSEPRLSERILGPKRSTATTDVARNAQQTRLIGRVSRAFQAAQQRGGGPLKIRLHPRELGSLKLELQVEKGVMTAKLEVETQSARTALLDSLPNLRERLNEQGVRVEQFDVSLSGEGDHANSDLQEQQNEQRQERTSSGESVADVGDEQNESANTEPNEDGGLNVVV